MTSKLRILVATGTISAAMLGANPAFAAGTSAGDTITNNVSVAYQVGGVAQTAETDSDTFTVDRKLDMTITETDGAARAVFPGQTAADSPGNPPAYLTFTVTNDSNDEVDFALSATQLTTGTATPFSGTDDFDVSSLQIFVDSNGNGTYDAGVDTATFIDELGEDLSVEVFIVGDIPVAAVNGDSSGITLTASIRQGNDGVTGGAIGGAYSDDSGSANTEDGTVNAANIDNVFVNISDSATDNFVIDSANIAVAKTSTVLWDPINGSTNPKSIPGAVVEYCIAVTNSSATTAATNVAITDNISALDVTFYGTTIPSGPATIPTANGVVSATACDGTGTNADASGLGESSGTISGNLGDVAASGTFTWLLLSVQPSLLCSGLLILLPPPC